MTSSGAPPAEDAWRPWSPRELAQRLSGIQLPWCIVGGWALDLWHGRQTREHEDIEFSILRRDLGTFRTALCDLSFFTAGSGMVRPLPDGERPAEDIFQIWCLDTAQDCWRADMMLEPGTPDMWVYRRDPAISASRREMVDTTADGIPYLNAAAVLLFKAKHLRNKDRQDFEIALPRMRASERDWLGTSLRKTNPGHEWIAVL